ncbi:MAG: VOC family protein, partial [Blastococcus sp.]|nr:VOC family protein [Blastococcus sp.]
WDIVQMPDMGDYTLVMTGPSGDQGPTESGFINGGMLGREMAATRHPVLVVDVPSIDAMLARIPELGGSVVAGKTAVGEMGFAAYVSDPEGNVVGLWETAG